MKPNRAVRNSAKNSPSAQSAKTTEKVSVENRCRTIYLKLFSEHPEFPAHEFNLPEDVAGFIRAEAARREYRLPEFIAQAVREKINREGSGFSVPDFELAVQEALTVMDALTGKLLADHHEEMSFRSPEYNARLTTTICGYLRMADRARKSLFGQFQSACSFASAKGGAR